MSSNNSIDNNNKFEISLKLSKALEESGIIRKFVIDPTDKYVKLRLNSMYNPTVSLDVSLSVIKEKNGWEKFSNKFRDLKKTFKNIDYNHNIWIYSTVNENGDLIRSVARSINNNNNNNNTINNCQKQQQEQKKKKKNQKQNDINDESDKKNTNEEKIIIEKVSISEAIRRNSGTIAPTGTIIGISRLSKMISKVQVYCDKCAVYSERSFNPIPVSNTKDVKEKCDICERLIRSYNIKPIEYKSTVTIELQDTNSFDDLDRLPVFLFEKDTIGIKVGENVEVTGEIKILNNNFKYFPYLYCQSIQYLNRETFMLTKEDVDMIKEFYKTHKEDGIIDALVSIFDPSIVECEFEKKGIVMIAVNTSEKTGDESEHMDGLLIGPPGLAKSKLLKRSTEILPGSSRVGGQYATGKSLTAIVEKRDDNVFLTLGSIPRSRDAICAINELAKLSNEDLDKLYDVMEEREINFEKYGLKKSIPTPTSIIASANPANKDSWINDEKIDFNELPFIAPLKDRFDLIFILKYKTDLKEREEFANKLAEIEAKKANGELPDYTEFIIKYVQYAKKFNPVLTAEAWFMFREFYKKVNARGFGSPRVLKTLSKLGKAIARLKLKNIVDEKDAQEAMEYYNVMLVKFQKSVVYSESPKMIAYKKGAEILERNKNFGGITLEELVELICKEDKQLATFYGYDNEKSLKIKDNHKVRDIKELLLNHTNIKRIRDNPITLKWFDNSNSDEGDEHDEHDKKNYSKQEKNDKKNNENFYENGSEPTSSSSSSSSCNEEGSIKGFQFSKDGRIYETTDEHYRELTGENEGEDFK
jgi:DNA replicative helicase MCM subunit Mcm2 (Cdc46/Mcm family)